MQKTDYLVIGSGIAGLTFAVKIAQEFPEKKVTIITKGDSEESNTKYAQGRHRCCSRQRERFF